MKWKQETFKLKLHVIPHPVPLPIGIEEMKKIGMMLDLKNDKMSIGAPREKICRNKSGHILWNSRKIDENSDEEAESVKIFHGEEQKDIKKVHENLAHISSSRLWSMLLKTKFGKKLKQCILKKRKYEVIQRCEACDKNAKPGTKAKTAGLRATNFNERVAMDLTEWYD